MPSIAGVHDVRGIGFIAVSPTGPTYIVEPDGDDSWVTATFPPELLVGDAGADGQKVPAWNPDSSVEVVVNAKPYSATSKILGAMLAEQDAVKLSRLPWIGWAVTFFNAANGDTFAGGQMRLVQAPPMDYGFAAPGARQWTFEVERVAKAYGTAIVVVG